MASKNSWSSFSKLSHGAPCDGSSVSQHSTSRRATCMNRAAASRPARSGTPLRTRRLRPVLDELDPQLHEQYLVRRATYNAKVRGSGRRTRCAGCKVRSPRRTAGCRGVSTRRTGRRCGAGSSSGCRSISVIAQSGRCASMDAGARGRVLVSQRGERHSVQRASDASRPSTAGYPPVTRSRRRRRTSPRVACTPQEARTWRQESPVLSRTSPATLHGRACRWCSRASGSENRRACPAP